MATSDPTESAIGFIIPWEALAGGFSYHDGHVTPFTNGVMSPALSIAKATAVMYAANQIPDEDARVSMVNKLADVIIASATEMKRTYGSGSGA